MQVQNNGANATKKQQMHQARILSIIFQQTVLKTVLCWTWLDPPISEVARHSVSREALSSVCPLQHYMVDQSTTGTEWGAEEFSAV